MMSDGTNNDEIHMTTPELIAKHGYKPEIHHVWTEDGYCLEVHRVLSLDTKEQSSVNVEDQSKDSFNPSSGSVNTPTPNIVPNTTSKPPVIVNHGLLSSSADWVLLGPHKALAYALCDNGFDVWLMNARGTRYSKRHKQYTFKEKEFWNFSWHELGYYDVPATIDYVLEKTGYTDLYYVGYSQGTTSFYVMGSERPEYNSKVRVMVSLAPIAFLSNQRSPLLKCIVHFYNVVEWGASYCNIHEWFPRNQLQARALSTLIRNAPGPLTKGFCNCWFYLIAGFGSNQLDKSMLPLIFGHFPAGASAKQIVHYSQNILSGSFCKFDYGARENLKVYGSTQPPKYNLEKVKVPIFIFYSENDFLTHPADIQKLAEKLPNVLETKLVEYSKFNHIDYLWGRDARTLVYNSVTSILKRF